jgi:hypothetical protein
MKILFVYFILFISVAACSKKSQADNDTELPVITINNPLNNQTFTDGQTVTIVGAVTDNKYIAEVHIHINNVATGVKYLDVHLFPAAAYTAFAQDFTVNSGITYKIEIIAIDRSVNQAISSVQISCN